MPSHLVMPLSLAGSLSILLIIARRHLESANSRNQSLSSASLPVSADAMNRLPIEIMLQIIEDGCLNPKDLLNLGAANKTFQKFILPIVYNEIRIPYPGVHEMHHLPVKWIGLLQNGKLIKSFDLGKLSIFSYPMRDLLSSFENLTSLSFSFENFYPHNHFYYILWIALRHLHHLTTLKASITRRYHPRVISVYSQNVDGLELATGMRDIGGLGISGYEMGSVLMQLKEMGVPICQLKSVDFRARFVKGMCGRSDILCRDEFGELAGVLGMMRGCVGKLEELRFVVDMADVEAEVDDDAGPLYGRKVVDKKKKEVEPVLWVLEGWRKADVELGGWKEVGERIIKWSVMEK